MGITKKNRNKIRKRYWVALFFEQHIDMSDIFSEYKIKKHPVACSKIEMEKS